MLELEKELHRQFSNHSPLNNRVFGQLTVEQRIIVYRSWTKDKVKELRGYSDSTIVSKLMDYSEGDLQTIIDYADTLTFTSGSSKICRLAKEAKRKKEQVKKKAENIGPVITVKIAPQVQEAVSKAETTAETLKCIQNECPQLFESEDVALLYATKPQLVEAIVDFFKADPTKSKSLVLSLDSITAVKSEKCTIEDIYNAIPQELCVQLVSMMPWEPGPPSSSIINDDDILRYYIKKASKSFVGWDLLVFVIKKTLKKILGTPILPIPSVTTVYLFVNCSEMLSLLTYKHYGDKFLSKDKIVAISLSLVAMLLQLLNRESPLSYLKTAYSGGVYARDFVAKLPPDLKKWLLNAFFDNVNELTNGKIEDIITYNIITWNNILGELTEIDDLSMGKTIDMLYTFRVGATFLDYANSGKGMQLHSLSEYWKNYGPLPNNPAQMESLFSLFRNNPERCRNRFNATFTKYGQIIAGAKSYVEFLQRCAELYEELSFLVLSYRPASYEVNMLYTLKPKVSGKIVVYIANWANGISTLIEVKSSSLDQIERNIGNTIQLHSPFLIP